MAIHKDNHGDRTIGHGAHGAPAGSRLPPQASWLPMPQAPANDNDTELLGIVRAFLGRHINWFAPTLLLAVFSLTLLFLRS